MKKYTVKHLITSALLSLTALVVGYALLSLPFRLMDWLDPTQMKLVFAAEFVLYITVLGLVITRREKKLAAKKAAYARRQRRRARLARQKRHRPPPGFHHHCKRRPHCRLKQNML